MKGIIIVEDDGSQVPLDCGDFESKVPANDQIRALLRAVRYILDTPEGGSILDSAVLASRRARDWMKRGGSNGIVTMEQLVEAHSRCEAVRYQIKPEMIAGLLRYKDSQIPTGDFLRNVLENNLKEAVAAADHENQWAIPAIVSWCYNNLPTGSWGSPERVKAWLTRGETE